MVFVGTDRCGFALPASVVLEGIEPPTTLGVNQVLFQLSYKTAILRCASDGT